MSTNLDISIITIVMIIFPISLGTIQETMVTWIILIVPVTMMSTTLDISITTIRDTIRIIMITRTIIAVTLVTILVTTMIRTTRLHLVQVTTETNLI